MRRHGGPEVDVTLLSRAVGAMLAAALVLWLSKRHAPPGSSQPFSDLLGAVLVGMAVGRLFFLLEEGIDLLARPMELFFIRGGIAPVPAAIGGIGFLAWTCRSDLLNRLDHLAPTVLAGLAVWEAGCWWQGSCLGSPSALWWAMPLPGSDLPRHPVGMYASILLALGAVWLWRKPIRWRGASAAAGLGWASAVRLVTPLWSVGQLSHWAWWYLVGSVVGAVGVLTAWRRSEQPI
ncbi:MAG: prolipoprotein diacylglyceryl transferase [Actinomycetia bacterium]|nr:prolipoprotein diacylglyceryl transferase [Actinomycetes bacterium]